MSGTNFGVTGDPGADPTTGDAGSVNTQWMAAMGLGQGASFDTPISADTQSSNAIQQMAPAVASNTTTGSNTSGFWSQLVGSVVKTSAGVVAAQYGPPVAGSATPVPVPPTNKNGLVMLLGAGLVVYLLVTHKAA